MAKSQTLIQDDAPAQPIDETPTAPVAVDPTPDPIPSPPDPTPSAPGIRGFLMPDGQYIETAPPNVRPPGRIADQTTAAKGMWVRVAGGEWHKTPAIESSVWAKTRKVRTADEAVKLLVGN